MPNLSHVSYFVPEQRRSLSELSDRYRVTPAELAVFNRIYGLDKVPVSDISIEEMIVKTVTNTLVESDVNAGQIGLLIYAHTAHEFAPHSHSIMENVKRKTGLEHVTAFGMTTNKCASALYALDVIDRFLAGNSQYDYAILVTADVAFSNILQIIPGSSITGDAAVACLVNKNRRGHKLVAKGLQLFGEHAKCQWSEQEEQAVFEAQYTQRVADIMEQVRAESGLDWQQIKYVIPHNVNTYSWKKIAGMVKYPVKQIYLNKVKEIAHCFGADIFINWRSAEQEGLFHKGDYIMLVTVGLGANFGAMIYQYDMAGEY